MTEDHIQTRRNDEVAWIRLARPTEYNAMTLSMMEALETTINDHITNESATRCLVLTGMNESFATGADLSELQGDAGDKSHVRDLATTIHACIGRLVEAPFPVITGVNGVAAGAGFGLALAGDIVLMSENARFELGYPRIGFSVDGGLSYFLPRLVGLRRAQAILFRDRTITASEADELGLVTDLIPADDFDDAVEAEARTLAEGPTLAYAKIKELLQQSFHNGVREQMKAETAGVTKLTQTADFATGIAAFKSNTEPEFSGE